MQRAKDWLRGAEVELKAAHDLLQGKHWFWCCFTCQQATEKALKAVCESFKTPQFGRNLNMLLKAIESYTAVEESLRRACASLNRYCIPTRYPNAFDSGAPTDQFFKAGAREALKYAKKSDKVLLITLSNCPRFERMGCFLGELLEKKG